MLGGFAIDIVLFAVGSTATTTDGRSVTNCTPARWARG